TPRTWIIFRLVANAAINFQHTVIVFKHVGGHRTGEGVLGVGVNVHLDHTVGHRIRNSLGGRTGTTVEYQVKWLILTQFGANGILQFFEQTRAQLHAARFVDAVYVAEDQRGNIATVFTGAQGPDNGHRIFFGGVQFFVTFGCVAVFFAADDADFNFPALFMEGGALQELLGDAHVCWHGFCRAIPHMGLEDRVAAGFDFGFGGVQQRDHPVVEFVAHRVVGVDRNANTVVLGDFASECRESQRTGDHVFNIGAGEVFCPTVGNLNNAV